MAFSRNAIASERDFNIGSLIWNRLGIETIDAINATKPKITIAVLEFYAAVKLQCLQSFLFVEYDDAIGFRVKFAYAGIAAKPNVMFLVLK